MTPEPSMNMQVASLRNLTTPRPIAEYHEDMGPVLWWKFPIEEPPYVGSPNDLGHEIVIDVSAYGFGGAIEPHKTFEPPRFLVGGWPGYHTHFTPIPKVAQP